MVKYIVKLEIASVLRKMLFLLCFTEADEKRQGLFLQYFWRLRKWQASSLLLVPLDIQTVSKLY